MMRKLPTINLISRRPREVMLGKRGEDLEN
uniref:Uncharacterized protein n=1 Tax=Arundo donax TaxID=35708 RepID=A0A0A8Z2Z5_ARUDO